MHNDRVSIDLESVLSDVKDKSIEHKYDYLKTYYCEIYDQLIALSTSLEEVTEGNKELTEENTHLLNKIIALQNALEDVTRERDELVGLVKETVDLLVEMNNLNLKSYVLNQEYRIKKILSRTQVQKAMGG